MKMFILLLISIWLMFWVGFFLSGCMFGPRLGEYTYIQQPVHYQGAPARVIPIWVDKKFGEADQLAIDDAVRTWNYALNGYIRLEIVDRHFDWEVSKIVSQVNQRGWLFIKTNHLDPFIPPQKKNGYWTIGFVERVGGYHLYLVRDRLSNESIVGVTMHEIGHLLGAPHVGDRLMHPQWSREKSQCIDKETIKAVAAHQGIPADRLNYCVDNDSPEITKKPSDAAVLGLGCPLALDHP